MSSLLNEKKMEVKLMKGGLDVGFWWLRDWLEVEEERVCRGKIGRGGVRFAESGRREVRNRIGLRI